MIMKTKRCSKCKETIPVSGFSKNAASKDWHLTNQSPTLVVNGGRNGIDAGWVFANDKDNLMRRNSGYPWSMGAYEYYPAQ